jgi:hypothetical protein
MFIDRIYSDPTTQRSERLRFVASRVRQLMPTSQRGQHLAAQVLTFELKPIVEV